MARRVEAGQRDVDFDERPFGDSHFGAVPRRPRGAERSRASRAGSPKRSTHGDNPSPASIYAWHEGCFDEVSPARRRQTRPPSRPVPGKTGG